MMRWPWSAPPADPIFQLDQQQARALSMLSVQPGFNVLRAYIDMMMLERAHQQAFHTIEVKDKSGRIVQPAKSMERLSGEMAGMSLFRNVLDDIAAGKMLPPDETEKEEGDGSREA